MDSLPASRMPLEITDRLLERFWSKVNRYDADGVCWPWTGASQGTGYGALKVDGKKIDAHVLSWRIAHGGAPIPEGLEVRHSCDARACCRPEHLLIGTRSDNMRDASSRKRLVLPSGEGHRSAVMTREAVFFARCRAFDGVRREFILEEIKDRFGIVISPKGLQKILSWETWKHVDGP